MSGALRELPDVKTLFEAADALGSESASSSSSTEAHPGALIAEVEGCGCYLALVDGRPCVKGNRKTMPAHLLERLKANRDAVIQYLREREQAAPPAYNQITQERSGIRLDKSTGKLHTFGSPSSDWLRAQGWEWDRNRRRFMAPYPFDREDPHPSCMIGGGPKLPKGFPDVMYEPEPQEERAA